MSATPATFTVQEIAERFRIGQHSVLVLIRSGELSAFNVARRQSTRPSWRVSAAAVEQFERARAPQPVPKQIRSRRRRGEADGVVQFFT